MQVRDDLIGAVEQHAFGDFQIEALRRQARRVSASFTVVNTLPTRNCIGDRLTASLTCSGHSLASAQARAGRNCRAA